MNKKNREEMLKRRTLDQVSDGLARLRAAFCALTIFHTFEDDAAAQAFFQELEEIEGRVKRLCERIR